MCGITGVINFHQDKPVDDGLLKKMTDLMGHRGPDDEGYYVNGNVALGHRRLSIIDVAEGNQPMFSSDNQKVLVFNGELYNYIELREELVNLGHKFKTSSDTEVVIHAYEEWGTGCLKKFNGMWAFALWDNIRKHLLLSRDRIGEKPLFYAAYNNRFVFASELKSIFEYGVPRRTRPELIEVYLVLTNVPTPHTFYHDVFKLKPGHYIIVNADGFKEKKYWDLPEIDENNMRKDKNNIYEEFEHLFKESIKIRMRSDVPYGAFLSGGLDSSSIVNVMSEISNHPVETFTIGFPDKDFDESELALLVAKKFNTNHHVGTIQPDNFTDMLNRSVYFFDEPFGDSSALPTWQVSRFAAEKVKMVLTGDGGDEVLSGYRSYQGLKFISLYSQLPGFLKSHLPKAAKQIAGLFSGRPRYKLNRVANVLETAVLPFYVRTANKRCYTSLAVVKKLTEGIENKISIEDFLRDIMSKVPYKDDFYKLMYLNLKHDIVDDYLVKVDRMSMANSLETRAPFLDHRLIELMVTVDKDVKLSGFERKSVLRKTIGKQLPEELLKAKKKGFGVPLREWFKDKSILNEIELNSLKQICDTRTIDKVITDNKNGKVDNGNFIWTMLMLDKFLD